MLIRRLLLIGIACAAVTGCASMQGRDPLQVTVAGIEPLQGQGMELRMLVKLRVQNPNDSPVDYDGVAVEMDVQGKTFATGVTDARGSVPRFGETVQEQADVRDDANGLRRAAVAQLGDDGRVDVDTDHAHP